jgi:aarF domain-containing kinase
VTIHLLRLLTLACPLALSSPFVLLARKCLPVIEEMWWDYASWAARLSSPALMKFLQWASTRRDMFPATFCDRFESFQENAPTHPWNRTLETLEMAYGEKWHDVFEIDEVPIGSGCIAQVYRGTLHSTGEEIAIKVIHPEVKQMVALDLDLMRFFVSIMEMIPRLQYLSGRDSLEEFANIMTRQLDLKLEAENLLQFSKHFHDRKGLRFPVPNLKYTNDYVLVETLENGEHLKKIFSQLDRKSKKEVAHRILDSYLRMVFLDNFAHGDMHPGNLLFDIDIKSRNQSDVDVIVVDAGIVTKLDPEDLSNFVELFHAVATNQGYRAGELIVMRNRANNQRSKMLDENIEVFCRGVEKIVSEALKWNLKLNQVHVGSLLREVMELCCRHEVKLEGKYASIVVAIGVLEAVGRKLDPEIDILSVALPIILKSQLKSIGKQRFDST